MKDKCSDCGGKGFISLLVSEVKCIKCNNSLENHHDDYEKGLSPCPEFNSGITIDGDFSVSENEDVHITEGTSNKIPCLGVHKGYESFMHSIDEFMASIEEYDN